MSTWTYVPCGCPWCKDRPLAEGTVCRDPECQPGPGLDHLATAGKKEKQRRARTVQLLRKQTLTPEEESELDDLLHWHIHGG